MSFTIAKEFAFSASHQLSHLENPDHPCKRLHGHNYTVTMILEGEDTNNDGFVQDYRELDPVKKWIDAELDHKHLNDVFRDSLDTTAENLARRIYYRWTAFYPALVAVRVSETPKTYSEFRP